jgi:hypothetical protein
MSEDVKDWEIELDWEPEYPVDKEEQSIPGQQCPFCDSPEEPITSLTKRHWQEELVDKNFTCWTVTFNNGIPSHRGGLCHARREVKLESQLAAQAKELATMTIIKNGWVERCADQAALLRKALKVVELYIKRASKSKCYSEDWYDLDEMMQALLLALKAVDNLKPDIS